MFQRKRPGLSEDALSPRLRAFVATAFSTARVPGAAMCIAPMLVLRGKA